MFQGITLALAGGFAVIASSGSASAQQRFDGAWSVLVVTEKGVCDRSYRFPVKIQNGRVSYDGAEEIDATGAVGSNGAIKGSLGRGAAQATVTGRLAAESGAGAWTGSGSLSCSGQWTAERRP
jgi:hypothetical protein